MSKTGLDKLLSFRLSSDEISFFINQILLLFGVELLVLKSLKEEKITLTLERNRAMVSIFTESLSDESKTILFERCRSFFLIPDNFNRMEMITFDGHGLICIRSTYIDLSRATVKRRTSSSTESTESSMPSPSLLDENHFGIE